MRETTFAALQASLDTCERKLAARAATADDSEGPAAATGAALAEWAAGCEGWLSKAAGNTGSLPEKYTRRCAAPVRRPVMMQKPGKDGVVIPPGTAIAAVLAGRLAEFVGNSHAAAPSRSPGRPRGRPF